MTTVELIDLLLSLDVDGTTRVILPGLHESHHSVVGAKIATVNLSPGQVFKDVALPHIEVEEGKAGEEVILIF